MAKVTKRVLRNESEYPVLCKIFVLLLSFAAVSFVVSLVGGGGVKAIGAGAAIVDVTFVAVVVFAFAAIGVLPLLTLFAVVGAMVVGRIDDFVVLCIVHQGRFECAT